MTDRGKVTCFLTRLGARDTEVCVFEHPSAGIQLPAGTLLDGEQPTMGAKREAFEETGLRDLTLVGELAVIPVGGSSRALRHLVHFHVPGPASGEWWVITPDGGGLCWRCHWLPLDVAANALHPNQQPWLALVRDDVLASPSPVAAAGPRRPADLRSDLTIEVFWAVAGDRALVSWIDPHDAPDDALVVRSEAVAFAPSGDVVAVVENEALGWTLPGGHREAGETVVDTLRREVREEACADVVDFELLGYLRRDYVDGSHPSGPEWDAMFWARVALDEFRPQHEVSARTLLTRDAALDLPLWRNPITSRMLTRAIEVDGDR